MVLSHTYLSSDHSFMNKMARTILPASRVQNNILIRLREIKVSNDVHYYFAGLCLTPVLHATSFKSIIFQLLHWPTVLALNLVI